MPHLFHHDGEAHGIYLSALAAGKGLHDDMLGAVDDDLRSLHLAHPLVVQDTVLGLTAAGAAGAGAYYWLKNRHNEEPEDEFDDSFEEDDFELDDDLGEVPERGYTTLTPTSAKEEASEEPVEKNKDAETESEKAASQTQEDDSEESAPASEEI